ncbi:molecular chaperone [Providencia rettgeri]|uniref:hypothetical protein n=1 Tax=Providencia alcalifaciens TaxID=126385 RepID=UPI00029C3612|nr:hypothetical protein [Providencia alcalifaciens]EKT61728.1 hypothetical protein OO9_19525 [Providencia alcalifaciens Dmel2]
MTSKKDMFSRLSNVSKNAPLQESTINKENNVDSSSVKNPKEKIKKERKPKNLQIPKDLWDAYELLKKNNETSLLMTPYILEAFREKLAKDGAFDKNK